MLLPKKAFQLRESWYSLQPPQEALESQGIRFVILVGSAAVDDVAQIA
jgi:hypothetical protein